MLKKYDMKGELVSTGSELRLGAFVYEHGD